MAVNVNETETKYDAPAGAALPRLDDLPQVADTSRSAGERLEAEYYDTDDLRLIRAGITLRRRRGGDDAGWHLKLPLGADARREIQLPLGRAGRRVPSELAELVRVHTRSEPLRPVAGKQASRFAKQMKKVQSVLGDHQDAVIARQVERELGIGAHLAGENAFSYGLLYGATPAMPNGFGRRHGQRGIGLPALATGAGCTSVPGHRAAQAHVRFAGLVRSLPTAGRRGSSAPYPLRRS